MAQNKSFISLVIEFIIIFYILLAIGPSLDEAFSNWTGILAPFGAIMRFLAPGPDQTLLALIETSLITTGTAKFFASSN